MQSGGKQPWDTHSDNNARHDDGRTFRAAERNQKKSYKRYLAKIGERVEMDPRSSETLQTAVGDLLAECVHELGYSLVDITPPARRKSFSSCDDLSITNSGDDAGVPSDSSNDSQYSDLSWSESESEYEEESDHESLDSTARESDEESDCFSETERGDLEDTD